MFPQDHLLRSIDRFVDLSDIRQYLAEFYSHTGRPSIDPELLIRMLLVGYCESFNGRMRDELLNGETFYYLREAQIIIENWRKHHNTDRPHSGFGYRPPAPEATIPMDQKAKRP
jgi:transposase InsO family protein